MNWEQSSNMPGAYYLCTICDAQGYGYHQCPRQTKPPIDRLGQLTVGVATGNSYGWECPKCGQVWAPSVMRCDDGCDNRRLTRYCGMGTGGTTGGTAG